MGHTNLEPIVYKDAWHKPLTDTIFSLIRDMIFEPILTTLRNDILEPNPGESIRWVFFYGTLKKTKKVETVLRHHVKEIYDSLSNYRRISYTTEEGKGYNTVISSTGDMVEGKRIRISGSDIQVLDDWEADYKRKVVTLDSGLQAWVFVLQSQYVVDPLAVNINVNDMPSELEKAIKDGRIQFRGGKFIGKYNSKISKEIKELGGKLYRNVWYLPEHKLTFKLRRAIEVNAAEMTFIYSNLQKRFEKMTLNTQNIVKHMSLESLGVEGMDKVSKEFKRTVRTKLAIQPKLDSLGTAMVDEDYLKTTEKPIRLKCLWEYENGVRDAVENFSQEVVEDLRERLGKMILDGDPRDLIIKEVMNRLNISYERSKFIARQETSLLTSKFKQAQYMEYGINKYKWRTNGDHKVRLSHKALNNTVQDWLNPPVVGPGDKRCHPGEDWNCRCIATPMVDW